MAEITASDITGGSLGENICLISCLSFEERSIATAKLVASNGLSTWLCLQNSDIETDVGVLKGRATAFCEAGNAKLSFYEISKKDPLLLADAMISALRASAISNMRVVVDITTMTHEMVLVFAAAAAELGMLDGDLTVIYNTAGQYSSTESDFSRRWISRGIHGVRSVIGFPGLWSPGSTTNLVALPGFDLERVQRISEELEPDRIIVGIGKPGLLAHEWLYERNKQVADQLIGTRGGHIFEYEALDPQETIRAVCAAVKHVGGNVVIAPFNSKISTLAVGLIATGRPEWQVCYAPALIYNKDYATASDIFLCYSLKDLYKLANDVIGLG